MDAAIISLLATLIAMMFGGFWLLWRTIHKDNTDIRKDMAEQNTDIRKDMAEQNIGIRQYITEQNASIRKDMAEQNASILQYITEQNTDIRKDIADLRQDHTRLEATMETLLKLIPTLANPETSTAGDVQPSSAS